MELRTQCKAICPEFEEVVDAFIDELEKMSVLFAKKQADYGPGNIAKFGEVGLLVRMNDKFERLTNLFVNRKNANNEAIEDTLRDIANYAVIWLLVRQGKWPDARKYRICKEEDNA